MSGLELSNLPDHSELLAPPVVRLRRRAALLGGLSGFGSLSDGFLLKFLRARDFDEDLALKVAGSSGEQTSNTSPTSSSWTMHLKGTDRTHLLVLLGQRGLIYWFYWDRENKCTGFTGTERTTVLVLLGQRGLIYWFYWDREDKCTGFIGTERTNLLGQRGLIYWFYWDSRRQMYWFYWDRDDKRT